MKPDAVRSHLESLPWNDYTHLDLCDLYLTFMEAISTIRIRKVEILKAKRLAELRELPMPTPDPTKNHVYPPGQRFE